MWELNESPIKHLWICISGLCCSCLLSSCLNEKRLYVFLKVWLPQMSIVSLTFLFCSQWIQQEVQHPKAKSVERRRAFPQQFGNQHLICLRLVSTWSVRTHPDAVAIPLKPAAVRGKSGAESLKSQLQPLRGGRDGETGCCVQQKSLNWRSSHDHLIVMRLHSEEARKPQPRREHFPADVRKRVAPPLQRWS